MTNKPEAGLSRRITSALDHPSAGLGFALVALFVSVLVFGVAPVGVALGLLALLAID